MHKAPLTVIVLTFDEEMNLDACLRSVHGWVEDIIIVDSHSTDRTLDIAKQYGCRIYDRDFKNQADQLNWALREVPINTEWVMRLDADEYVTVDLKNEITNKLSGLDPDIAGLYVKRRVYFMGKWIKYGGYYPTRLLRIWRKGRCMCEERWMDEHMKLIEGRAVHLKHDIVDDNKKSLHWWIGKHNSYATREAIEMLNLRYGFMKYDKIEPKLFTGTQEQRKRWLKVNLYSRMPLFIRPFAYFIYRYFVKLGFLDGREGLIWHFMQGFWYRFLVDAKILEIKRRINNSGKQVRDVVREIYGIEL